MTPEDPPELPRERFAQVVREAREQRGWSQDQLAEEAGVSRPTVQRYEYGKTATPDPEASRRIFRALGLDTRLIPVVLGYVTAEEMDIRAEPPRVLTPITERIIAMLEDPKISAAVKEEWLEYFNYRIARAGAAVASGQALDARVDTTPPTT